MSTIVSPVTPGEVQLLLGLAGNASQANALRLQLEIISLHQNIPIANLLPWIKTANNETILHEAVKAGAASIVNLLDPLFNGPISNERAEARDWFVNAKTSQGENAIMLAARGGYTEIIDKLFFHGASLTSANNTGATAFMIATAANELGALGAMMELLQNQDWDDQLPATAYIHRPDNSGEQPLHVAARNGNEEIAALLISKDANVDAASVVGSTPLHIAAEQGDEIMADLLLQNGSALEPRDLTGRTAWGIALANIWSDSGSGGVVGLLLGRYQALWRLQRGNGFGGDGRSDDGDDQDRDDGRGPSS